MHAVHSTLLETLTTHDPRYSTSDAWKDFCVRNYSLHETQQEGAYKFGGMGPALAYFKNHADQQTFDRLRETFHKEVLVHRGAYFSQIFEKMCTHLLHPEKQEFPLLGKGTPSQEPLGSSTSNTPGLAPLLILPTAGKEPGQGQLGLGNFAHSLSTY
jgi:hypothetical protein